MRGLHDAELSNLAIDKLNATIEISFIMGNNKNCKVVLRGVKSFRSHDIVIQNVLSRLLISSDDEFSESETSKWIEWSTSLSDAGTWLTEKQLAEWSQSCNDRTLNLVVFEPSAGAEIASVCESVSIYYE